MSKLFKTSLLIVVFLSLSSQVHAFTLTPPANLVINGQNITTGIFTLEGLSAFDQTLNETIILDPNDPADDISQQVVIGNPQPYTLVDEMKTSLVLFNYNFDATAPDLDPVPGNVLNASKNLMLFLPAQSPLSFYQVVDISGNNFFFSQAPMLSLVAPTKTLFIDLLGDQSIFANFDASTQIGSANFVKHGSVSWVPIPATVWLFVSGIVGIFSLSRNKKVLPLS